MQLHDVGSLIFRRIPLQSSPHQRSSHEPQPHSSTSPIPPVHAQSPPSPPMGKDEYSTAIGGGLKLKGGKPNGVMKKKKKRNKVKDQLEEALTGSGSEKAVVKSQTREQEDKEAGAPEDTKEHEDSDSQDLYEGKTEAERKHEEMRRKRVRPFSPLPSPSPSLPLPSPPNHTCSRTHTLTS